MCVIFGTVWRVHKCFNCFSLVIETLKQVDGDRKCYRMVGGVLVERQAKDVLPVLTTNQEQVSEIHYQFCFIIYSLLF